jgi:hypothetical protein
MLYRRGCSPVRHGRAIDVGVAGSACNNRTPERQQRMHSVRFTAETSSTGVLERDFTVDEVTGVLWSPASSCDSRAPGTGGSRWRYPQEGTGNGRTCAPHRDRLRFPGRRHRRARARRPTAYSGRRAGDRGAAAGDGGGRAGWPDRGPLQRSPGGACRAGVAGDPGRPAGTAGAFASKEKTLHANAGAHKELPRFESDSAVRFFGCHLGRDTASPA